MKLPRETELCLFRNFIEIQNRGILNTIRTVANTNQAT